jgi:hypothetical protein
MPAKPFTHSGRDAWGTSHGSAAGKGDKPRHKLDDKFRENFDNIDFGPRDPNAPRKFRKVYGRSLSSLAMACTADPFTGRKDR